jgi:exopolysaccharide biosynthesis polyprenyl glycosylphosphotransferase
MLNARQAGPSNDLDSGNGRGPSIYHLTGRASELTATGIRLNPPSLLATGPLDLLPTGSRPLPKWLPRYVMALLVLDVLAIVIGGSFSWLVRFDTLGGNIYGVAYFLVLLGTTPAWLLAMATARSYEGRYLGIGSEEFRRVANAAARFTALVAIVVYLFRLEIARGLLVVALPAATLLALTFRYLARRALHRIRQSGGASHRVLVVGEGQSRDVLTTRLTSAPHCGLRVVGVCRPLIDLPGGNVSVDHVRKYVKSFKADTVAIAQSPSVQPEVLRQIAWSLEGCGVDLLVAPAMTDVAGPRVSIRPVSGLPLLQVTEPEFTGVRRLAKSAFDLMGASLALLLVSPLFLMLAIAVRLSSEGPVFFRQVRIGRNGREFVMFKFRSMYADAEQRLAELKASNDHGDGVLFKMRNDPRITKVGKFLRRFSLDELPQLINVLFGQMSLVGPRPPLPSEVAMYANHVHRRLLVKPGLTGLWQVSGRSDLDWDETVRLDLYYVENWSVALDAEIVWKTIWAVLRGSGAR